MNATRQIDWDAVTAKAESMSIEACRFAITDIQATLKPSDELDREDGGCRGGYYRDEISIYRRVLACKLVGK